MSRILKPNAILLASSLPRVLSVSSVRGAVEDDYGRLNQRDNGNLIYYWDRNVFDITGAIVPPAHVVEVLNNESSQMHLQYGVPQNETKFRGTLTNGGQITAERLSPKDKLNMSALYYCTSKDQLGYILAETPHEKRKLQANGYVSVASRL